MSTANPIWLMLFTFIVGFSVPTQTGINAQLGRYLGHPLLASLISFVVGSVSLLLFALAARIPWPAAERATGLPWWIWTGGIFGALFVTTTIIMAPRLGATTTLSLIVAGQMMASLYFDHYGYLSFPEHPVNAMRILGVGLLILGVYLVHRF